ncbi:MAG TPA: pyridoxamine 5'-phosphate oxidase [Candidatus Angelobacter sp.]|nr:pyridoxamine 5'-phosphate oxidase [Candidatus Angelobacter sp.]
MKSVLTNNSLDESRVSSDPFKQFRRWLLEAAGRRAPLPETMTLATATRSGRPSARTLLLRTFDNSGFVFYTNYSGRKGKELAENPQAALVFYWPRLGRQIRVEGRVVSVSPRESDSYFSSRPRDSQLSAWASQQSRVVPDRRFLENEVKRFNEKYPGRVPRSPNWGGYRLQPSIFEFWKERPGRLHDRLRYRRSKGRWIIERLAP